MAWGFVSKMRNEYESMDKENSLNGKKYRI